MERVRITIDPADVELPRTYGLVAGDDRDLAAVLERDPALDEFAVLPVDEDRVYCFLEGEATPAARALFENFTRGGLLTVPPVEVHADGRSTFTIVGAKRTSRPPSTACPSRWP